MKSRIFWIWFVIGALSFWMAFPLGAVLAMLNARFLSEFVQFALQILAAPGVVVSLPVLNHVASPWWSVGVIGILNGAAYGFSAWFVARLLRKRHSAER